MLYQLNCLGQVAFSSFDSASSLNWTQINVRLRDRQIYQAGSMVRADRLASLWCLTAQDLRVAVSASESDFLLKVQVFPSELPSAWLSYQLSFQRTSGSLINFFVQYFFVPAWLGKCRRTRSKGFRECFPCFGCSISGELSNCTVCTACLGFGDAHLPCQVQDAITVVVTSAKLLFPLCIAVIQLFCSVWRCWKLTVLQKRVAVLFF